MPKISVIMPAYNAERYIREAIDSVLKQSFEDFEFIILNDCSADTTEQIILSYSDPRIIYLKNEENMGVAATLNRGLDIAVGEYIARMDADDIAMPERFQMQVDYLDSHPGVVVCGSSIVPFNENGNSPMRSFPGQPEAAKIELLFMPCVAHPTVMIRGSVLREKKLAYSLELEGAEDYGLWWEIAKYGDIVSLPLCLLRYRVHPNQASRNSLHRRERFRRFVDQRMADLGTALTTEENSVFFRYTCSELKGASETEVKIFIDVLIKVLEANRISKYFDEKRCVQRLRQAAFLSIEEAAISTSQKREKYRMLADHGLSVTWYRIKRRIRSLMG